MKQFLETGEVVSTHGVRGEIKVYPWADGPEFLLNFDELRIGGVDYEVEQSRVQKNCVLLKLRGVAALTSSTIRFIMCATPSSSLDPHTKSAASRQLLLAFFTATPSPAKRSISASLSPFPNAAVCSAGSPRMAHRRFKAAPLPAAASDISIRRGEELVT